MVFQYTTGSVLSDAFTRLLPIMCASPTTVVYTPSAAPVRDVYFSVRQPQLTAHQVKMMRKLNERHDEDDNQVVVDLKVEASEVAADVRTLYPSIAANMYVQLGRGHIHVLNPDMIVLLNTVTQQ